MKRIFLLLLFLFSIACRGDSADEPSFVSLVALLANAEKYNGKKVAVVGYLELNSGPLPLDGLPGSSGHSSDVLYLHREDQIASITKNGLALETTLDMSKAYKELHQHYVLIKGIFDAEAHGYLSLYGGTIRDISAVTLWPPKP